MNIRECNNSDHDNVLLPSLQIQPQLPDHLKCGEVYTWLCEGELYAVECKLCEDRPMCPLSEFPQHMEVWHTDWEESVNREVDKDSQDHNEDKNDDDDEDHQFDNEDQHFNEVNDELQISFTTEDSGLYEDEPEDELIENHPLLIERVEADEKILEPFEQVLIEHDNNVDSTQINENENEDEEKTEEYHKKLARTTKRKIINGQQHKKDNKLQLPNINNLIKENCKQKEQLKELRKHINLTTERKKTKDQIKEKRDNALELRDNENITENIRDQENDLVNKNCSKETEKLRNCEKIEGKPTSIKCKTDTSDSSKNKYEEVLSNEFITPVKKSENQEWLEKSTLVSSNFTSLNTIRVSLRQSKKKLNKIASKEKDKFNKVSVNQNPKTLENFEKSLDLKEDLTLNQENSNDLKENPTNKSKSTLRVQKGKKKDTKVIENLKDSYTNICDLEQTLFNNDIENSDNSKTIKENLTKKIQPSERVQKRKTIKFPQETKEKEKLDNENVKINNKSKSISDLKESFTDILSTNLEELQNCTKGNINSKNLSLRAIKRKSNSENELQKSLYSNEEGNIPDLEENFTEILSTNREEPQNFADSNFSKISSTNLEESQNSTKNNINNKKRSSRALKRKYNSNNVCDLEKSLFTNEEENIDDLEEYLKKISPSQSSTKRKLSLRAKKRTTKVVVTNLDKNLSALEKSFLANDEESICDVEEMLLTNLEESRSSINNNRHRKTLTLRATVRKTKLAATQQSETLCDLEKIGITNGEEILMEKRAQMTKTEEKNLIDKLLDPHNNNENFGDLAKETNEPSGLKLTPIKDCLNLSTFDTLKQSCTKKKKIFLRKLREKSAFIKNLRTSSESSLDLEKTLPSLTVDNLKSQELELLKATQENLRTSENSPNLENDSITNSDTLTPMDIYDLLSINSMKNVSNSSYGTESSTFYSPASLTSDDLNVNHASLSFKQNLNNLFEFSNTFNDQHLKPVTPQSPKTEEEHFEFYEPKEKLTKHHILKLIELYKEHTCLWDQSHPEFCESQLSRISWQDLTDKWNEYCKRKFTIAEVRIRICTLSQRYLKERERLELEGELDESCKFSYYEEMKFLEQQKSLQKRRELYEQQNEKVVEIYQHFPVLWHVGCHNLRQAAERTRAFQSISTALKLCGIQLSSQEVQKRIRSLRKFYRLDKIRYLHCQVEQTPFESDFKHFERMQFLDKHIDPFVCRICGKIFENLTGYREHLDTENHGSILEEDSESESEKEKEFEENDAGFDGIDDIIEFDETVNTSPNELETLTTHSEETPPTETRSYTKTILTSIPYINEVTLSTTSPIINEDLIYPNNSTEESILNSLQSEDQIFEEIMENVTYNDSFTTQSLDNFINSVSNCDDDITLNNCINSETLTTNLMYMKYSDINVQNVIVIDQTLDIETPNHNDHTDMQVNLSDINKNPEIPNQNYETDMAENQNIINENQELEKALAEDNSPPPIVVKVQCADYSLDLNLNTEKETSKISACIDNPEVDTAEMDGIFARLPHEDIRKMIVLYRKYPQLWNPNHLDYNSRNLRRLAWCNLTAEYCKLLGRQFSWRTIHRKLTDYAKYYKKLLTEQKDYEDTEIKWAFYKDFKFLDDVIAVHDELQRSVHHRDNNFKIIGIYKYLPQLWDIKHPDFNKRPVKQRNIELMCYRLQEEYNLQITPERLKNRLIELRAQYRAAKKQRLKALKNKQIYTPDFEFYEALLFIDQHIDPFICELCNEEFKKLTDYNHHRRKEHETKKVLRQTPLSLTEHKAGNDHLLENVCHICGIKFTTKSNLVHHLRRHDGIKNYACTQCTKKFFSSHSLKIHIRSHTKECPYTCEKCGASFVCASKLNQHVKRHTNKKDFQCDYCPKAFFTAFEMDRHVRRHLNIRDKICPICNKSFVVGSSYYAHMMLHNDTKRFACDKCDMKFAQYAGLYKHKKRHH